VIAHDDPANHAITGTAVELKAMEVGVSGGEVLEDPLGRVIEIKDHFNALRVLAKSFNDNVGGVAGCAFHQDWPGTFGNLDPRCSLDPVYAGGEGDCVIGFGFLTCAEQLEII